MCRDKYKEIITGMQTLNLQRNPKNPKETRYTPIALPQRKYEKYVLDQNRMARRRWGNA